jgi:hypothetical protein
MRILGTILNEPIVENDDKSVDYTSHEEIDDDGSDNRWQDPDWQRDTSLHYPAKPNPAGKPIDAGSVPYVVVPTLIIDSVAGIVLGCRAVVTHKDKTVEAVVADVGPHKKLGEGSVELANRLGIPSSPVSGGDEKFDVHYKLFPGTPAVVDGVTYDLQPS